MAVKKKKKSSKDSKKESVYRGLAAQLSESGFKVRREKLKQGFGWKVMSGQCVMESERLIFVDSRMTQDDQIAFLQSKLQLIEGSSGKEVEEPPESESEVLREQVGNL